MMRTATGIILAALGALLLLTGCEPSDRTPGLWLRGEVVDPPPADWSFTDAHQEIFVEVATPYFLPHSVTIWCAQVHGQLFIGARDPDTKNWPGWLAQDRDIRLKIGPRVYPVSAVDVTDEDTLAAIRAAYAEKYALDPSVKRDVRYWAVVPRGTRPEG
jgi:hypothetical protein